MKIPKKLNSQPESWYVCKYLSTFTIVYRFKIQKLTYICITIRAFSLCPESKICKLNKRNYNEVNGSYLLDNIKHIS